jgi:DNA-binding transcriptional MerR regulator
MHSRQWYCYFKPAGGELNRMPMQYRIGEFADLGGVSANTLRYYDEIGLLNPARVDPRTGYRFYLPKQLQELASIVALKELGVPLAKLRDLIRKPQSGKLRREVLLDLRDTVTQSIQAASQSLAWIDAALNELDQSGTPVSVVVKRQPAILIASIRSKVQTYSEIERFEQELLADVPAQSRGDLRGVLWHRCADSDYLEGEAFVALRERVSRRGVYDVTQLPSATLACAYSPSDDEGCERVYDAIRRWTTVRGYRLAGPKREIYRRGMLEIQFPLTSH